MSCFHTAHTNLSLLFPIASGLHYFALMYLTGPIRLLPAGGSLVLVSLVHGRAEFSVTLFPLYCSCFSVNVDNFPIWSPMTTLK